MKPHIKFGIIVGLICLILIVPVTWFLGICGPGVSMLAGGIAGFIGAYYGNASTRKEGAQSGAIAGVISGAILLIGQLVGTILALVFLQAADVPTVFGSVPDSSSPAYESALYYAMGIGTGLCIGIVGLVLGAGVGALAGMFGTRQSPQVGAIARSL